MTITRVLVAHDAGARMFENRGPGKGLTALGAVDFEDGRRHVGELTADRGGRGHGGGPVGSAYEPARDPREHATAHFARELAKDLGRDLRKGAFTQLVLVAPPRFLGLLRGALDGPLSRALIASVAKDLPRASESELRDQLAPYLAC
jgi:protein required for attachment to host cells